MINAIVLIHAEVAPDSGDRAGGGRPGRGRRGLLVRRGRRPDRLVRSATTSRSPKWSPRGINKVDGVDEDRHAHRFPVLLERRRRRRFLDRRADPAGGRVWARTPKSPGPRFVAYSYIPGAAPRRWSPRTTCGGLLGRPVSIAAAAASSPGRESPPRDRRRSPRNAAIAPRRVEQDRVAHRPGLARQAPRGRWRHSSRRLHRAAPRAVPGRCRDRCGSSVTTRTSPSRTMWTVRRGRGGEFVESVVAAHHQRRVPALGKHSGDRAEIEILETRIRSARRADAPDWSAARAR